MKYITFVVPSYNSEAYLERCVKSLLPGGEDVEIIIVNDGSTDNTGKIADMYANLYPNIIKAVHKENGGHGSGINVGIERANGIYFKVVDSDDWVNEGSYLTLLNKIKEVVEHSDKTIDLFVSNYVYNHLDKGSFHRIHYRNVFDSNKISTWEDIKYFTISQYFLMHALTFRTDIIRMAGVKLPEHTFYVDNIFAYQPLPYVKNLIYLDIDFYQYYIGREDQSVNEKSMLKRIDQQFTVTRTVLNSYNIKQIKQMSPKLTKYMIRQICILMSITSVLCSLANTNEYKSEMKKLWAELRDTDKWLYNQVKYFSFNVVSTLPEPICDKVSISCYRFAKRRYMFA
ncbi:glycosyltransferase involved in cell wall biosynthesis [Anaerobacterium chartisolvens]|uniref:Glycosyltransferase involved in cell wall biosynthesis n=1 Tax=Anaerobacterium chartisolvens TaxID=1297424 RepID=A0A369B3G2_9FIRM|nr:glycosyltransferase family 2 protein [Anaerobacterium chartisolvens]RCX16122.1 glycosyltransferase involved in cell wall biosynthesis [Anaerobacterium chartisolvens]